MFNFSKFFLEKNGFCGQQKCWYFWKMDSFSNTLNRFKNETSLQSRGLRPLTPCGGGRLVVAFKWPGRSPSPRKKSWRRHWIQFSIVSYHPRLYFTWKGTTSPNSNSICQFDSDREDFVIHYIKKSRLPSLLAPLHLNQQNLLY